MTEAAAPPPLPGDAPAWLGIRRRWWVFAVALPSIVLAELTFTALLFSSVFVLQGIDSDVYGYQIATGPYIVCLVVLALLSVRFAQRWGSRRTFMVGAVITGIGCLVAGSAGSLAAMVVGRLLLSAKVLVLAVTLSQLWIVAPHRKGFAMAVYSAAMYGGLFGGMALGGFLQFQVPWRSIYLVSGVLFLLLAVAGRRALIADRPAKPPPLVINVAEVAWLSIAIASAVFLIFRGPYFGWLDSNLVVGAFAIAALSTAAFVWTSLREPNPLVNLRLASFPTLALTLTLIGIFSAAVVGMLNTLPAYLALRGYPSEVEGAILLGPALLIALACVGTGFVYGRATCILLMWAGLALNLGANLWFIGADLYTSKATLVAMLSLWAIGAGLVLPIALRLTFAGQTAAAVQRLAGAKVALRFAATVLGAFAASLVIQRATDGALDHLRQGVTANNITYRQTVARIAEHVATRGSEPGLAQEQAGAVVGQWVGRNAQLIGIQAGRRYVALLTALALLVALCLRFRTEVSILAEDERSFDLFARREVGRIEGELASGGRAASR